jgi:hypothetical protein
MRKTEGKAAVTRERAWKKSEFDVSISSEFISRSYIVHGKSGVVRNAAILRAHDRLSLSDFREHHGWAVVRMIWGIAGDGSMSFMAIWEYE